MGIWTIPKINEAIYALRTPYHFVLFHHIVGYLPAEMLSHRFHSFMKHNKQILPIIGRQFPLVHCGDKCFSSFGICMKSVSGL